MAGGSQRVTVPHTARSPSGDCSMIWPPANATVPPAPYTLFSATGHHRPIRAVKTSNATAGSASTSTSRRIGGTILVAPPAPVTAAPFPVTAAPSPVTAAPSPVTAAPSPVTAASRWSWLLLGWSRPLLHCPGPPSPVTGPGLPAVVGG